MKIDPNLIYDIGLHDGSDTAFYLKKGFKVVAIDANQKFIDLARQIFKDDINDNRLILVEGALDFKVGRTKFYISDLKDDWSSTVKEYGNRVGDAREVEVDTFTLEFLFDKFGIPYYLKSDIEGGDICVVKSLLRSQLKPKFVSVELHGVEYACILNSAGYDRFKLVNQNLNWHNAPPKLNKEGDYADWQFGPHSSGNFGLDIAGEWLGIEDFLDLYLGIWRRLRDKPHLFNGWFDIHATTHDNLNNSVFFIA